MGLKDNLQANGPIFIIGSPRSGTTLLRLMISSHSKVTIPHEYTLVENVIEHFNLERNPQIKVFKFIDKQYTLTHFLDWRIDKKYLINKFKNDFYSQREIINIFYSVYLETHTPEKSIWGDKNINSLSYISEIYHLFPAAKFIHIVRDGRDVAASLQSRKWMFYSFRGKHNFFIKHCKGAIDTWIAALDITHDAFKMLPESAYCTIRYEDLIVDPEKTLKSICQSVNLEFEEDMLDYYKNEKEKSTISLKRLKGNHDNILKPVLSGNKQKYLSFYKKNDLKYIESRALKKLKQYDYEVEYASQSASFFTLLKIDVIYSILFLFNKILYALKSTIKKIIT